MSGEDIVEIANTPGDDRAYLAVLGVAALVGIPMIFAGEAVGGLTLLVIAVGSTASLWFKAGDIDRSVQFRVSAAGIEVPGSTYEGPIAWSRVSCIAFAQPHRQPGLMKIFVDDTSGPPPSEDAWTSGLWALASPAQIEIGSDYLAGGRRAVRAAVKRFSPKTPVI